MDKPVEYYKDKYGTHPVFEPDLSDCVKQSDYEDSDVLDKVKNVDGVGSGLDADKFQGADKSDFWNSDNVTFSTSEPTSEDGVDGDIWIVIEP